MQALAFRPTSLGAPATEGSAESAPLIPKCGSVAASSVGVAGEELYSEGAAKASNAEEERDIPSGRSASDTEGSEGGSADCSLLAQEFTGLGGVTANRSISVRNMLCIAGDEWLEGSVPQVQSAVVFMVGRAPLILKTDS
eukprot:Filipodium_phascolosomae@DN5760_c0_g1_i2.p2